VPQIRPSVDTARYKIFYLLTYLPVYDVIQVEHETAESMQTLLKLDTIKARMKAASDALRVSQW